MHLNIRLSSSNAIEPTRANEDDAGLDLYVPLHEGAWIEPGAKATVNTHIQVAIPRGYVGLLFARSSLQKSWLMLANNVGVIDAGYRGDLKVVLLNTSNEVQGLRAGEKFAQLVIVPIITPTPVVSAASDEEWESTTRGTGGFGSSGK